LVFDFLCLSLKIYVAIYKKAFMQNKNGLIGGVPMEIMQVCAVYFFSSFISGRQK